MEDGWVLVEGVVEEIKSLEHALKSYCIFEV